MRIQRVDRPMKYFIVDDFIPTPLADAMIEEVVRLRPVMQPGMMRTHQKGGQFVGESVSEKKRNFDCFLDATYRENRPQSVILSNMNKLFFAPELVKAYADTGDMLYSYLLPRANFDQTHLSAYGNGHYYRKHIDLPPCFLTANVMLSTDPKQFTGGDFQIHWSANHIDTLEFRPRRMILFPSAITHCATDVQMPEDLDFRHWRFTIQYWPQYRERR